MLEVKVTTGDAITREVMSRHHYHTQRHVTTGHAASSVPEHPVELSAEQTEAVLKRNVELWQEVGKNEARIQQLERELRPSPAAASGVSEGATATPFEVAVSRQEGLEEQQDFDSELDVSPRIGVEQKEAIRKFEELSEHPPRAVTQRQHARQRAQQGV